MADQYKLDITAKARVNAEIMSAPLIYCSAEENINMTEIIKEAICEAFDLKRKVSKARDPLKEALTELSPEAQRRVEAQLRAKEKAALEKQIERERAQENKEMFAILREARRRRRVARKDSEKVFLKEATRRRRVAGRANRKRKSAGNPVFLEGQESISDEDMT